MLHDYRLARTDSIERLPIVVGSYARKKPIREDIQKLCICDSGVPKGGPIFDEVVPALIRIPHYSRAGTRRGKQGTPGILPIGLGADGLGERDFGVRTAFEELDIEDIRGIGDITTRARAIDGAAKAGDRGGTCGRESAAGDIGDGIRVSIAAITTVSSRTTVGATSTRATITSIATPAVIIASTSAAPPRAIPAITARCTRTAIAASRTYEATIHQVSSCTIVYEEYPERAASSISTCSACPTATATAAAATTTTATPPTAWTAK
jgi:ribosomal protein L37AE/L43A